MSLCVCFLHVFFFFIHVCMKAGVTYVWFERARAQVLMYFGTCVSGVCQCVCVCVCLCV